MNWSEFYRMGQAPPEHAVSAMRSVASSEANTRRELAEIFLPDIVRPF